MYSPTADEVASIQIKTPIDWNSKIRKPGVTERYKRLIMRSKKDLSDTKLENDVYKLSMVIPEWLKSIQESINKSVYTVANLEQDDERSINQEVADAASDFFLKTADLLPSEPHIYRSKKGDLVSEYKTNTGNLTIIISPSFVILFAIVNGDPVERKITKLNVVRMEVEEFLGSLATG